jgi:hypothetical protein
MTGPQARSYWPMSSAVVSWPWNRGSSMRSVAGAAAGSNPIACSSW